MSPRERAYRVDPATIEKDVWPGAAPGKIKTPYLSDYKVDYENIYFHRLYYEPFSKNAFRLCVVTPGLDDTIGGAGGYKMFYQISRDAGKTFNDPCPVIQKGREFNPRHPVRPVYIPENAYCGSHAAPVRASNGKIMCPFEFRPLDENGKARASRYFPIFLNAGVLIGEWMDNARDIEWDLGETLDISPEISTRGLNEPALIELKWDGHFLLVMRGSNAKRPDLPAYKWKSVSTDYCRTWTAPEPFAYSDGSNFFSPASCCDLRRNAKNGKVYWFGNITPENGNGNDYRYPLVVAEVDEDALAIKKDTVAVIDTRRPENGDSEKVQFSNFNIREDAASGDFIVSLRIYDFARYPTRGEHYIDHPERYGRLGAYRISVHPEGGCSVSDISSPPQFEIGRV